MTIEMIQEILKNREKIAKEQGNYTEFSLIQELIKIVEEHKELQKWYRVLKLIIQKIKACGLKNTD